MVRAIQTYVVEAFAELSHVDWPNRKTVVRYTLTIVASVLVAMLVISLIDYGLGLLVDRYIIS